MASLPPTRLEHLLDLWSREPTIAGNVVEWRTEDQRPAHLVDFPPGLHPVLQAYLRQKGIRALYSHQGLSWKAAAAGKHAVIVTGTASGKTLCYNLPVLDLALRDPAARALFIFPTKALTQDQLQGLREAAGFAADATASAPLGVAVYDGDTPSADRPAIRRQARLILTNPDMLHTGILPHHTLWAEFFRNLRFVIIDEIHVYRGVFGSHVANVLRRLKRVAAFYGSWPQFILTSATIANPGDLATRLIEAPAEIIDQDGAPRGRRHFLLYNPPIVNPELGLRASSSSESIRLVGDLLDQGMQSLLFARARRTVELMLRSLSTNRGDNGDGALRSYRSGYLPRERRAIEAALRDGSARAVVATNALELGIDIGGMDAVLLVGYPGTIASTRQQAGRAGRKQGDALAVLVASASPLDQYLMHHPEYIFERSPEQALINPDNLLILLQHLRCAAFELPFKAGDTFGSLPASTLDSFLQFLTQTGELHASGPSYFWMADRYPADGVSLRSSSPMRFTLQSAEAAGPRVIGEVDYESAMWMVHPQAVYLHGGQVYEVQSLDLENKVAHLLPADVDYYTEPRKQVEIEKLSVLREAEVSGGKIGFGEVLVTTQVIGFRRLKWYTNENLGEGVLDLPPTQLRTTGYWLAVSEATVETLREAGAWKNDPNDYGPNWPMQRKLALLRDARTCQVCGQVEAGQPFHVHHKTPFRNFASYAQANHLDNLITLCPACHRQAEASVKMKSGLSGLMYVLHNLAPLFLMCDVGDLGALADPLSPLADKHPAVALYDLVPAGIGLAEAIFEMHASLMQRARELVAECPCTSGCPSCVGPAGPNGVGGKAETLALLNCLI